jgi:two-component system, chemotaxis family, CheB/CheR fusion protein
MLFREEISAAKLDIKLQVFASDVNPDAIASAREGLYPDKIEADVSVSRPTRFFSKEEQNYRVSPELRAAVVFTVQDVLADPPFSRIDFASCRNLLIYLRPEAQAKVLALFHFALRESGILLLGTLETAGTEEDRFEIVSKAERIYGHIGHGRPGEFGFLRGTGEGVRAPIRPGLAVPPSRRAVLAELCQRMVMDAYAPAAVLISRKHECLYSLGPTDRFLRLVPGHSSQDLLAMARHGVRTNSAPRSSRPARGTRPSQSPAAGQTRGTIQVRSASRSNRSVAKARTCCWYASSMTQRPDRRATSRASRTTFRGRPNWSRSWK